MEYSNENLKKLHETLLCILDYVDNVCRKNNITYYLNCGSVLGAVRHGGFIPWDDDIDIILPRESYNKLLRCLMESDSDEYIIQNETNESNYFSLFSKIRKKGTVFIEKDLEGLYKENGIYIDIFPLDFSNEIESLSYRFDTLKIRLIKHTLRYRKCKKVYKRTRGNISYLLSGLLTIPLIGLNDHSLFEKANRLMQKRNNKERKYAISYTGIYGFDKETMEYKVYYPPIMMKFEGKEYPICNDYDFYLSNYYGDYMKLPPEDKRHTHEPVELKF